ncbi:unnamed protein product [Vitrella brassicaformis CCMP3155]|uniref:Uncharacterized protein n=1 Tax=Vitrella brassicaformis (strain CCMP3155) TaxID=1169540 RepID=A0A0G4GXX9_VITBC|nr:unnamed protein product [Vitrella brassicaformis CCMP3155]|eukprot:CEM35872.1 unnamed protein product [Vitrella brassicaformis CCMP3155]
MNPLLEAQQTAKQAGVHGVHHPGFYDEQSMGQSLLLLSSHSMARVQEVLAECQEHVKTRRMQTNINDIQNAVIIQALKHQSVVWELKYKVIAHSYARLKRDALIRDALRSAAAAKAVPATRDERAGTTHFDAKRVTEEPVLGAPHMDEQGITTTGRVAERGPTSSQAAENASERAVTDDTQGPEGTRNGGGTDDTSTKAAEEARARDIAAWPTGMEEPPATTAASAYGQPMEAAAALTDGVQQMEPPPPEPFPVLDGPFRPPGASKDGSGPFKEAAPPVSLDERARKMGGTAESPELRRQVDEWRELALLNLMNERTPHWLEAYLDFFDGALQTDE